MASITSLPPETLLQIFKDDSLAPTDLAHCAQTCLKFRDLACLPDYKIDYVFKVDHPSHSGWRLIRCILLNPALGERIQTLRLEWHRRRRRERDTWTLKWDWTEDELTKISEICKKWNLNPSLYPAIEIGLNSEALLPLLFCLTTKLESLDVGDVGHDMISDEYGHTVYDAIRIYTHCMGSPPPDSSQPSPLATDEVSLTKWFESGGAKYEPRGRLCEPLSSIPWIYTTFTPGSWLPGLSNIKEFSHGGSNSIALRYRPNYLNDWPNKNIPTILQLPNLETLKLSHINALMGTPICDGPKPVHKLKRLEIFHYRFYRTDFEIVARLTGGSLENVVCILSDENFTPWDMPPDQKIAVITDYFEENSKDTLARDKISVVRSFKGFFDDFEFKGRENMLLLSEVHRSSPDEYGNIYLFEASDQEREEWSEDEIMEDGQDSQDGEDGEDESER
ncbi:hypothetical protein EYR41_011367 [Orbilia oligospora]|uniref:F-box domain-containing protein n=1 Tax=Orbilia oligospora TaxID=2813651 RepID=A0A7C8PET3_ORBOL|nr:hypothetical protein TWF751_009884 [Orbilia oligospora]TGJ63440.1 hypothetical protein EYR41_011367 [Orbilia oligospora]